MASTTISLTADMLNALREYVKSNIAYAMYKVGNTYYRAELQEKQVLADGRVSVTFLIDHTVAGNITVTEVQLYNYSGVKWAAKSVSIKRQDATEGILYRCRFTVSEAA
ncbi:MAG: hypothetical protein IJ523_10615 [Succinivibrionaceae bacterium]|nr:hypothetical protein [Succinivibrionaceae bacterium]